MLRNSKYSNISRSFQSRTFKNSRVITSNISVILKPERSLRRFVQKISSQQNNKIINKQTPGHHANFVFLGFAKPQNM